MRKVLVSLIVLIIAFFALSPTQAMAKVITDQKGEVNIAKTEVINDDLFVGSKTVVIDGTINGDVFVGAEQVKITGVINGSLHVGTKVLDLGGTVKGNVYGGAQEINLTKSTVGGSVIVGASEVKIDKDSNIGGSVFAGAGKLTVDSQVKRSVYAGAGALTIGDNAKVGKDLHYAAKKDHTQTNISSKAKIAGEVNKSEIDTTPANDKIKEAKKQVAYALPRIWLATKITSFIGAVIVGLIYLKLFSKHFSQVTHLISNSPWKSFGVGFLTSVAFIPGIIILLMTVVGIPVAGMAILLLALYAYLATIVTSAAVGNWISTKFNWKMPGYGALVLGLLVVYTLKVLPIAGFFVGLGIFWLGLGALTLKMFSSKTS